MSTRWIIRRHTVEALIAVLFLFLASAWIGSLPTQQLNESGYTWVAPHVLVENPGRFEGMNISTKVTINGSFSDESGMCYSSEEGINLVCSIEDPPLSLGDTVIVRGVSYLETNQTFVVGELYVLDTSSSIIRSIPGIILFVIVFFSVFRLDVKSLSFKQR